ncbi:MAG TPA: ORF6N domain-containing protein [Burkholderiaceae bacterium]|jgi:hypothetical protein|nr:ORF6N domain-containing protein [Burkholderiaceae bacterium]
MSPKSSRSAGGALVVDALANRIHLVLGHRVMLDADLAALYGVQTKVLVQAVKRNLARFPEDFMFQLSGEEWANLRSQFVTSSSGHGGRRTAPYAFTEQGVAMLSSVLAERRLGRLLLFFINFQVFDVMAGERQVLEGTLREAPYGDVQLLSVLAHTRPGTPEPFTVRGLVTGVENSTKLSQSLEQFKSTLIARIDASDPSRGLDSVAGRGWQSCPLSQPRLLAFTHRPPSDGK